MKTLTENKQGFWRGLYRYVYYKTVVPVKRERRGPEYVARGTAVGIFFGLAPVIFQMNMVLLAWLAARYFKWNFSLPVGLAWTWVSNMFTSLPLLYLYYVTGQLMRGSEGKGYAGFTAMFDNGIWQGIKAAAFELGGSVALGSLVYVAAGTALGYVISYKYFVYKRRREKEFADSARVGEREGGEA